VPAEGKPISNTLPVAKLHVGGVISPTIGAEGRALTTVVTASEATLWHPDAFVTRTVKLPDVFTFMLWVVAPVDQRNVVPVLEVKVTLLPAQKVTDPVVEMTGCAGNALTVTETCELTVLKPSFTATWYTVLTEGVAIGLAREEVNPAGTDVQL
jgi:hypothetical protein